MIVSVEVFLIIIIVVIKHDNFTVLVLILLNIRNDLRRRLVELTNSI